VSDSAGVLAAAKAQIFFKSLLRAAGNEREIEVANLQDNKIICE
jgi:hypothetical protein